LTSLLAVLVCLLGAARTVMCKDVAAAPAAVGEQLVPTPGIPSTGFPRLDQYRASRVAMFTDDFGQLTKYRYDNSVQPRAVDNRVIFFGDSITEEWRLERYFPGKPYLNRGIGGQTTPQMLVRFRQDIVDLRPKVVVILAGTNDIAGNTGPMLVDDTVADLASMADLARANGIRVVLASVTPINNYTPSSQDLFAQRPLSKITAINQWLKDYCSRSGIVYLDYFAAMVDNQGMLKRELAEDGLHPNDNGYKVMGPLVEAAIAQAMRRP